MALGALLLIAACSSSEPPIHNTIPQALDGRAGDQVNFTEVHVSPSPAPEFIAEIDLWGFSVRHKGVLEGAGSIIVFVKIQDVDSDPKPGDALQISGGLPIGSGELVVNAFAVAHR